jgi:hypothetical protein
LSDASSSNGALLGIELGPALGIELRDGLGIKLGAREGNPECPIYQYLLLSSFFKPSGTGKKLCLCTPITK